MRRCALLLLWAAACSETKPQAGATPVAPDEPPSAVVSARPTSAQAPLQQRPVHKLRVRTLIGADAGPLALGSELSTARELTLPADSTLELTLDDYAAIRLLGPATFRVLPDGEPALLLRDGLATIDCAPRAARATASAFWLATPTARLDVVQSARFVVQARPERASELAVVSGWVDVRRPAARPVTVGAGELGCLAENVPAPARATELDKLERAEQRLRSHPGCGAKAHAPEVSEPLRRALAALTEQGAEERTLLAEHQGLLADASPQASALAKKLALLGAQRLSQLEAARALRASFEAARLGRPLSAAQQALRQRAEELAPYRD